MISKNHLRKDYQLQIHHKLMRTVPQYSARIGQDVLEKGM